MQNSTTPRAFIHALLIGLSFAVTMSLAEGLYIAWQEADIPYWAALFNVGASAPFSLVLGLGIAASIVSWRWVPGLEPRGIMGMWRKGVMWSWEGSPKERTWRSAWVVGGLLSAGLWLMMAVMVGARIRTAVATPEFGALLFVGILFAGALLIALAAPILVAPLAWVLIGLVERSERLARVVRPGSVFVFLGVGGGAVFVAALVLYFEVMRLLPWAFVVGPVVAFGVALTGARLLGDRPRAASAVIAALLLSMGGMGVLVVHLPPSARLVRGLLFERPTTTSYWMGWLEGRLDYDHDGQSAYFGGGDCAPNDPEIGPNALDIVDNGIDEDCDGVDFTLDPSVYKTGSTHHPRPSGVVDRPNIILVTTDALSYRHTTMGGYSRNTTPNLAKWAERATVFEAAFAAGSGTRLAMPGLMLGRFNSEVPMKSASVHPYPWGDEVVSIASLLSEQGYRTVHVAGCKHFGTFAWPGFDVVERAYKSPADKGHPAPEVTEAVLAHIDADDPRPLFLWVHYYDHHAPYKTPKGKARFTGKSARDRYDNELHYADKSWGTLFERIESRWDEDEVIVIFSSDHGESFDRNHPKKHHGHDLHTVLLHVPFIVQGPMQRGTHVDGLVSHMDLLPTLANIVGIEPDPELLGESLVPVLFEGAPVEKNVLFSLFYIPEDRTNSKEPFRKMGVRTDELYYFVDMRRDKRRLVRWREDRLDEDDLSEELPNAFAMHRYLLAERLQWLRDRERGLVGVK